MKREDVGPFFSPLEDKDFGSTTYRCLSRRIFHSRAPRPASRYLEASCYKSDSRRPVDTPCSNDPGTSLAPLAAVTENSGEDSWLNNF